MAPRRQNFILLRGKSRRVVPTFRQFAPRSVISLSKLSRETTKTARNVVSLSNSSRETALKQVALPWRGQSNYNLICLSGNKPERTTQREYLWESRQGPQRESQQESQQERLREPQRGTQGTLRASQQGTRGRFPRCTLRA